MSTVNYQLRTYLNYGGNCAQALRFYEKHLGGKITTMMTHGEVPGADSPPEMKDAILHARIMIGQTEILASDTPPERFQPMRSAYLSLNVPDSDEAERVFGLLSQGGEIFMPMQENFYAFRFGMLRDQFGTSWMVIHERPHNTSVNMTTTPDTVSRPEAHYVFLERIGPFATNAPQAWKELLQLVPAIVAHNQVTGSFSLYKVAPQIYRAGVSVAAKPEHLPAGLAYEKLPGGNYARFILTGSWSQLPQACQRAFTIASELKVPLRDDYNIENYVNNLENTPEDQLITEILFPTA